MKAKYILPMVLVVSLLTSCSIENTIATSNDANTSTSIEIEESNIISSSESNKEDEKPVSHLNDIISTINPIIDENKNNLALYYYNFSSEDAYAINENNYFVTASLKKVPLAMQVLDKVAAGELSLDTEIEYQYSDYANGTGILQFEDTIEKRTVKELIILSMIESDNIAFNMLNRTCGNTLTEYINSLLQEEAMIIENDITKLTAKHHFEIFQKLYTNENNNPYYEIIIESLKDTAFNDSINKYLPDGTVAHKIGSYYRYYHDAAIVFGEQDYILIILTKDIGELSDHPDFAEDDDDRNLTDWGKQSFELMAIISREIYNIVNN